MDKKILVLLAIASLLIFGCVASQAGQGAPNETGVNKTGVPPVSQINKTVAPAKNITKANATVAKPSPDAEKFAQLIGLRNSSQWKAEYSVVSFLANNRSLKQKLVQYVDGQNMRIDSGSSLDSRTYIFGNTTYSCYLNGTGWSCKKLRGAPSALSDIEKNPLSYNPKSNGTMNITGTQTECFWLSKKPFEMRYCLPKTGVPLYTWRRMNLTGNSQVSEITALNYTLGVLPADFALPAVPK